VLYVYRGVTGATKGGEYAIQAARIRGYQAPQGVGSTAYGTAWHNRMVSQTVGSGLCVSSHGARGNRKSIEDAEV